MTMEELDAIYAKSGVEPNTAISNALNAARILAELEPRRLINNRISYGTRSADIRRLTQRIENEKGNSAEVGPRQIASIELAILFKIIISNNHATVEGVEQDDEVDAFFDVDIELMNRRRDEHERHLERETNRKQRIMQRQKEESKQRSRRVTRRWLPPS